MPCAQHVSLNAYLFYYRTRAWQRSTRWSRRGARYGWGTRRVSIKRWSAWGRSGRSWRRNESSSTAQSSVPHTPPQQRQPPAMFTPQTAPATFSQAPAHSHTPHASTSTITSTPEITASSPSSPADTAQPLPPRVNGNMLAALSDSRSQPLSRESRISLPDEARQYIANMGETPVPSPRVDAFAPRVLPTAPSAPSQSQFLDLEDEGPGVDLVTVDGGGGGGFTRRRWI
ncbi:hypothetical protein C8R44DRAFT_275493 [Mycena epipterygia]|nr:hypothetical protein C8R44DRAFT_275493 [Mycena epipterygia]